MLLQTEFLSNFRRVFDLFSKKTKQRVFSLTVLQLFLSSLEILIVLLLATIAVASPALFKVKSTLESSNLNKLESIMQFIGLSPNNPLALVATFVLVFVAKSLLAMTLTNEMVKSLSHEAVGVTRRVSLGLFKKSELMLSAKSQELLSATTTGVDFLVIIYFSSFILIIADALTLIVITCAIVFLFPSLALISIPTVVLLIVSLKKLSFDKTQELGLLDARLTSKVNRKFLDLVGIHAELGLSGKTSEAISEFSDSRRTQIEIRKSLFMIPFYSKYIMEIGVITVAAVISGSQYFLGGIEATLSSFVLLFGVFTRVLPSLLRLQASFINLRAAEGRAVYLIEELDSMSIEHDYIYRSEEVRSEEFVASINVNDLDFTFENESKPSLNQVNLKVDPGDFVAIVGPSGSGKSTLLEIILGLREPSKGSVLVSNTQSRNLSNIFPGRVSFVPQNVVILDDTLETNISLEYGSNIDRKGLENALRLSGLSDFAHSIPLGVKTELGELGSRLSGGQIQRIGLARALYTNPKLLLVDEATSSLDTLIEDEIMSNLFSIRTQVTILMVAHRLSTIRHATRIYYLDNGSVRGYGNFTELRKLVPEFDAQASAAGL